MKLLAGKENRNSGRSCHGANCILGIFLGLLMILSGCSLLGPSDNETSQTSKPENTTSVITRQEETTISVTETQEKTADDSDEGTISAEEKLAAAPDITGTRKEIVQRDGLQRILYFSLSNNPYGYPPDMVVGEYKYEVFLDDQRSGGIALAAHAAEHYLEEALEAMPADQLRWLLTLPVDLSDCISLRPIIIDLSFEPFINRPYYIRVSSEDEILGIVNILDDNQEVVIGSFGMFGMSYVISRTSDENMKIIPGQEMDFLFVIARFQENPEINGDYRFGDRLGRTSEPVLAGLTTVRGPLWEHDFDSILMIQGCPVFLMANEDQ